ncbi:hypothetical protein BD410DRAFT_879310 [Rickenella mellea]|uniref:Phosphatidylserine decarboxylase n=1 Tax=Rickenella mellea TaxID=50990 RepID=A0A4Y7QH76_9AGAM|nr:hypothetical protein BD410DRAFT_879310 [Rickenella mellea]
MEPITTGRSQSDSNSPIPIANGASPHVNPLKDDDQSKKTRRKDDKAKRSQFQKLIRKVQPESYADHEQLQEALQLLVTNSSSPPAVLVGETSLGPPSRYGWLSHLFTPKKLKQLIAAEHLGNFVIVRATGDKIFESMPIYARIGMHLLFHGALQVRLLRWKRLRNLLKNESIRQGKIYDSTDPAIVRPHIHSFMETYHIDLTELLQPDPRSYMTFNEFFSRKLKPDARKAASPEDFSIVVSAADCRLTVWPTWDASRKFWVKGRHFTVSTLLHDPSLVTAIGPDPSLAIFRLAPQDYHRFHIPVTGTVTQITHIPGEYYTVNPQAINERFDVLTANTRTVARIDAQLAVGTGAETYTVPVAVVAVGALLVGSIKWDCQEGDKLAKGNGFGYFQYGGSTIILVMPKGVVWDPDLVKNSAGGLETLVKAGERIGQVGATKSI